MSIKNFLYKYIHKIETFFSLNEIWPGIGEINYRRPELGILTTFEQPWKLSWKDYSALWYWSTMTEFKRLIWSNICHFIHPVTPCLGRTFPYVLCSLNLVFSFEMTQLPSHSFLTTILLKKKSTFSLRKTRTPWTFIIQQNIFLVKRKKKEKMWAMPFLKTASCEVFQVKC